MSTEPASPTSSDPAALIAAELEVAERQVAAAITLLDSGSTVPFVARYRKEATGGLDDAQLRTLEERLRYLRELDERRSAILDSIREQGKLTPELEARIRATDSKARLEDIYLPYKPKRRTKAQIAREAGLEPLADALLAREVDDPAQAARAYVDDDRGVPDAGAALEGARAILSERFAEDADLLGLLRERLWARGRLVSKVREGMEVEGAKYSDYFDNADALAALPSHRILAMFRAEKEDVLTLTVEPDDEAGFEEVVAAHVGVRTDAADNPVNAWLQGTVHWAWRTRLLVHLGIDARTRLRQYAEDEAVKVFAANLRDLLLAAPAGGRTTMGLDPGLRTGVKVAVVDATGKVVDTATIYPHAPHKRWDEALATLAALTKRHGVELIAIGNGTASRETDKLAAELISLVPQGKPTKVVVSEAGASVYSASAYASRELPELDVSLRGAVSIARRLQDPLAELVKIDPKSIGVGQYQHDVAETKLSRSLDAVVEDCVNAVGVDLNTASIPLLARVSGITTTLAENVVAHRDANGPFTTRQALAKVPRLGPKAFEQCAGFLRIPGGADPLDASGVHPEAYPVVRRILDSTGIELKALVGNGSVLGGLAPQDFVDERFGLPTVTDILAELRKPGRDPRPAFRTATFAEGVEKLEDLAPGLVLEGTVTNVAAFGAFVDVGVHQDGLVHISNLSRSYVSDPREVVKSGDVVRVKVLEVDLARKRIALTMRLDDAAGTPGQRGVQGHAEREQGRGEREPGRKRQNREGREGRGSSREGRGSSREGRGSSREGRGSSREGRGGGREGRGGEGREGGGGGREGRGGDRPRGSERRPEGAMADALRRAGLLDNG